MKFSVTIQTVLDHRKLFITPGDTIELTNTGEEQIVASIRFKKRDCYMDAYDAPVEIDIVFNPHKLLPMVIGETTV